jgi:hypothetical protein
MSLTKLSWPGKIELFKARESLASDILAGDGKIATFFYSVPFAPAAKGKRAKTAGRKKTKKTASHFAFIKIIFFSPNCLGLRKE